MRRVLALALFAAALLPLTARAQTITAAPGGNMTSLVGMPFDVPFYLDMTARTEKLGAFAARVQWNPAVLQFNGGNDGTFGAVTVNEDSLAAGVARIAAANPAGVGGLITLGILHFTPLAAQTDTLHFAVTELFAAGTFAALTPVTTRDGYFCPARGMFGDIDRDGAINSRDALIALSNAVGLDVSAFDITLGDVDGNGATNARDALIILSSAVGLPVAGFQVGRLAGGACSSNLPLVLTLVPDVVDLVVGQTVAFEARAADSSGVLQTVTNAIWKSGNTAALAVFGDGTALARDTGTVRVTAIRTALDSAQAVVHIVAHRTRQIVDATAASARNQLGSAAFPFATIGQGLAFAQDGDTVEVRPGRYEEQVSLSNAAVLMGDTLPDGTRPVVAGTSEYTGIQLQGTGAREVHDLALEGFGTGVDVYGPSRVLLRGLRSTHIPYGVAVEAPVGSLRIEKSRLTGNGVSNSGEGVATDAVVDTLVIQDAEISDFGGDGVLAAFTDSLAVLRSQIHDVGEYGIEATPNGGGECGEGCGPAVRAARASVLASPTVAVAVDSSTVVRAGNRVAYLEDTRSAVFAHSRLGGGEYGVEVYGTGQGWLRMVGDSIQAYGGYSYNWLYASYLDSLFVDSTYVSSQYGNAYNVNLIRITNTQFANAQDNPLNVSFGESHAGGQVFLDNVTIAGDPHCDLCGDGFDFGPSAVVANHLTAVNLWRGIQAVYDSSLTITHSLFQHVQYPIDWEVSSSDALSRLTVTNTTFSGFSDGINAYTGAVVVDSNTFQNGGGTAVYVENEAPARLTRNRMSNVHDGVEVYGSTTGQRTDTIADNVVTDLGNGSGIYANGYDATTFQILRNTVACNGAGATNATGIDLESANGVLAGNLVGGCYFGIYVYNDGTPPRVVSILGNQLTMPTGSDGLYVEGSIRSRIAYNQLAGDTAGVSSGGAIYVSGSGYQPGPTAVIDSNTITGGSFAGIYATWLDTALVRFNTVQGMKAPFGAIGTHGKLTYVAQIYGNSVRSIAGSGLLIYNGDTAMVNVDSNLVAYADIGINLYGGAVSVVHNRITGADSVGVAVTSSGVNTTRSVVDSNNIVGNRFGVQVPVEFTLQAPDNWWGDPAGPQCSASLELCDISSVGDSVSAGVAFTPVALAEFGTTPLPSVRALGTVALRAPAISGARRVAATGLNAPLTPKPRAGRARVTPPAQASRALAAARVPSGLGAARAQAWQRLLQLRTAALAGRLQRDAAEAGARQTRLAAVAAREQQQEQRKAARESARQAGLVKRAARAAHPIHGVRQ